MAVSVESTAHGYRLGPDEGEAYWLLGMLEIVKISGATTNGEYGLVEVTVRAGEGSPWHVHPDEDEWFYVLAGEFTVYVGDERLSLSPARLRSAPKVCRTLSLARRKGRKPWSASSPSCSRASCTRSASPQPSVCCRRRSRLRPTWLGSFPSARVTESRSSVLLARLQATDDKPGSTPTRTSARGRTWRRVLPLGLSRMRALGEWVQRCYETPP